MSRLIWHPVNPNQFWMFHTTQDSTSNVATLVETTKIQTTAHPTESHAVCQFHTPYCVMDGAVQVASTGSLIDLAWSGRNARHVLTVHDNGQIILWDMQQTQDNDDPYNMTTTPKRLAVIDDETEPLSRCCFLPHENAVQYPNEEDTLTTCFVTASHQNTVITLWSAITTGRVKPTKLQVINLSHGFGGESPSSYVLDLCFGPAPQDASPPSCFILLANRQSGKLLAIHVQSQWNANQKALCVGCDYVVPFVLKHPVYSWSVVCSPTQDISEEDISAQGGLIFDMKLFAYQSNAIQCLTLTSYMCLPPEQGYHDSTPGVTVELLNGAGSSAGVSEVDTVEPEYDEEYDVDDEEEEVVTPPEASALPSPDEEDIPMMQTTNPFANWLGAIATTSSSNTTGTLADVPLPPAPPPTPATGVDTKKTLPGLLGAPMGLPALAVADVRSTSVASSVSSNLLSPMDLLNSTHATDGSAAKSNNNNNKGATPNKARSETPTTKKTKPKKTRSKSPPGKGKNKNTKNANSPFPDVSKITILKRDDKPAVSPPPPRGVVTPDPASMVPSEAPAMIPTAAPAMATALPPHPDLEATLARVLSRELAKQKPPAPSAANSSVFFEAEVAKAVQQAMADQLVPAMNKVVQESLASFGRPLQTSINNLGKEGVSVNPNDLKAALDLDTPLKAAMANAMRHAFIPAMESISSQLFDQVQQSLPPPPSPQDAAIAKETAATLENVCHQLLSMNAKMDMMSQELVVLRTAVAENGPSQQRQKGPLAGQPQPPSIQQGGPGGLEMIRNEVKVLLQQQQYEAAFTKAVSSNSAEMVVYCCSRADLAMVMMGGNEPSLSQGILLCLMQQLGTALVMSTPASELNTELAWLQEIALTLNPAHPSVARHVGAVLQQLVAHINTKMAEGNPTLRRPLHMLLQVIRGMQMG
jgi:enhancer of mRNA-decapping protein 4